MRIALVGGRDHQQFPTEGYGGIETCVENLAWGLHARGVDFTCIVPLRQRRKSYPFEILESEAPPLSGPEANVWPFARSLPALVRRVRPDAVWVQGFWAAETLQHLGIPVICTFHDILMPRRRPYPGWLVPRRHTWYRFISKHQFGAWVDTGQPWQRERCFQLYTGMAEDEYAFGPPDRRQDHFLWVGGLKWGLKAKGLDIFIQLAARRRDKDFVAYGAGSRRMHAELTRLERKLSNFHFGGALARGRDHRRAFQRARLAILPSQVPDTFPRTVVESLSKGTPVLGTTCGALPEMIGADGGLAAGSLAAMQAYLDRRPDYRRCFEHARRFHIDREIDGLMAASIKLVAAGTLTADADNRPGRLGDRRKPSYFDQARAEVAELVDVDAGTRVLDVGCGRGGLGRELKERGCGRVVGIEIEPRAAAQARKNYDRVHVVDLDDLPESLGENPFDTIVCADVLEHLRDPWQVVGRLRGWLRPEGTLVASIPNLRNMNTLADLLKGDFDYTDWGVMDETHLRFFTRRSIERMFAGAGYEIRLLRPKCDPEADRVLELWRRHRLGERMGELAVMLGGQAGALSDDNLGELLTIQFLVTAVARD